MTAIGRAADRLLLRDAAAETMEHGLVDSADVLVGRPTVGTVALLDVAGVELGVWEITSGVVTDTEADEVFVVLAGRGQVEFEDGTSVALCAGTVVRLRAGDRTKWTIHETLRKIYVLLPDYKETAP